MYFKDRILAGTIAGMVASLLKTSLNVIFYKMGLVKYLYIQIAVSALLYTQDVYTFLGFWLGVVADLITGGTVGVIMIFLIKLTGNDYWWYKGVVFGAAVWLFGSGIILNLGVVHIIPAEPMFRLLSLGEHLLFGLITAYLIRQWYPQGK